MDITLLQILSIIKNRESGLEKIKTKFKTNLLHLNESRAKPTLRYSNVH